MVIYDGILNDQRIIFVGGPSTSCSKLSRLIFSTLSMVGPLAFGFIKRLHPYKNLYDLDVYKSALFLFLEKQRSDYDDVQILNTLLNLLLLIA